MTQKQTLWGGGAPQVGDYRLLEDSSERGGALGPDFVSPETAREGWGGDGERAAVSRGADVKANTQLGCGALQLLEHTIFLDAARDDDGGSNA